MDNRLIIKYTNGFRKSLTNHLKENIGIEIDIYNCGIEGAILNVIFKSNSFSLDREMNNYNSISDALKTIKQNFYGGNLSGLKFKGTNIMMDNNRILIIKDSDPSQWSSEKQREDVNKIIHPPKF